ASASQSTSARPVSKSATPAGSCTAWEHGIQPDGQMPSDKTIGGAATTLSTHCSSRRPALGKHVPRAVFVDLEPTVVDERLSVDYGKKSKLEFALSTRPRSTPTAPSWWTTRPSTTSAGATWISSAADLHQPEPSCWPDRVLHHASLRFDGALNTNLVAVPAHHFPLGHLRPGHLRREGLPRAAVRPEITNATFEPSNQMGEVRPPPRQVHGLLHAVPRPTLSPRTSMPPSPPSRQTHHPVRRLVPTGFKVGINYQPPHVVRRRDSPRVQRAVWHAEATPPPSQRPGPAWTTSST
uniref:FCP1 homology domain-containing protein n=1 Tax=Macrostomum lignano TaxID=282301 RepID=A0A1I8FGS4_9PLAT